MPADGWAHVLAVSHGRPLVDALPELLNMAQQVQLDEPAAAGTRHSGGPRLCSPRNCSSPSTAQTVIGFKQLGQAFLMAVPSSTRLIEHRRGSTGTSTAITTNRDMAARSEFATR
jgi:hypothetical protein